MTRLSELKVPGAQVAMCIAWEGRPTFVATFDAERIEDLFELYETRHELTPASRDSHDAHWRQYQRLLRLVMEGSAQDAGNWLYPAGMGLLWCGYHHPVLGEDLRRSGAAMLREIGRATMMMEIRQGTLFFFLSGDPLPSMEMPNDGHGDGKVEPEGMGLGNRSLTIARTDA